MGTKRELRHKGWWLSPAQVLHCADLAHGWLKHQAERICSRCGQGFFKDLLTTQWRCAYNQGSWLKPVVQ